MVVFEAGIANSCLSWSSIQPQIAQRAATLSYDRAGLGWSSAKGSEDTLDAMVGALHELLDALQVPRPFILVGHSFGGYMARLYAHRFPGEIYGLVLVDPATPEEWMEPTARQRFRLRRAVFFTRVAGVLACFGFVRCGLWLLLLRRQEEPSPVSRYIRTLQRIRVELKKIQPDVLPLIRAHWSRPGFYWAMARHLQIVPECARTVACCPVPPYIPITVLSGAHQPQERLAEHAAMGTKHIIAGQSAHFIHLDEPQLVIEAVNDMLALRKIG